MKKAGFNLGLTGSDPSFVGSGEFAPSVSPNYTAATSDSSLARARNGRPAVEQAATGFADLYRHLGIDSAPDQPTNITGGLNKTAVEPSTNVHTPTENRGPTSNVYDQVRIPGKAPVVGWGDEGNQRIERAFSQVDNTVDSTCIEGGWGGPAEGPAVLG